MDRPAETATLLDRLRDGDAEAFATVIDLHGPAMLRVARTFVPTHELAEDVVQETWMAVLHGIGGFEGRASLRTWIFSILVNVAKKRGLAERRHSDTERRAVAGGTVDPAQFRGPDDPYPGHWREPPTPFPDTPEGSLLGDELTRVATDALAELPERQREVVTLRDMLGFSSEEVCTLLDVSAANQRVLLHRGRAVVRQALADYLGATP